MEEAIIPVNKEETTVENLNESSTESITTLPDVDGSPLKTEAEVPKLEDETTILPELDNETTVEAEIEATTIFIEETSSTTQPTTIQTKISTKRMPKLIVKPSIHVIPPPSPTEFELLLTTLKEYVAKLENSLSTKKASDIDPPPTYVNYTVSRSVMGEDIEQEVEEEDDEEVKSISKRSAPSLDYFKRANKEKGCTYGKRHYKLGEEIRTDNECLECLCLYSPIGHCVKKKNCET